MFYCGTGWRAALTWFYAYLMGFSNIRLFDGGWSFFLNNYSKFDLFDLICIMIIVLFHRYEWS